MRITQKQRMSKGNRTAKPICIHYDNILLLGQTDMEERISFLWIPFLKLLQGNIGSLFLDIHNSTYNLLQNGQWRVQEKIAKIHLEEFFT